MTDTEQVKCKCQFCKTVGASDFFMNRIAGHHVCDVCRDVIMEIVEAAMDAREALDDADY